MKTKNDGRHDLSLYEYDLPREMIAQTPAERRDASRLMVLRRDTGGTAHSTFHEIGHFLKSGDLLVLNNTRVFPARVFGFRASTGRVEVLFLRDLGEGTWEAMVRCNGRPRAGEFLRLEGGRLTVRLLKDTADGTWHVGLPKGTDLLAVLQDIGHMPLPPYVKRGPDRALEPMDRERYQTVYAAETGAVAAPTAGLHFTRELLEALRRDGVGTTEITLHVGPGTFRPIRQADIRDHKMHGEFYRISPEAAGRIAETKQSGGRVVVVGTTTSRALEAAGASPEGFAPREAWTDLYIHPPYAFKVVDVLVTNFHLPRSTLLVMVSAFAGRERILAAYEEAKREGYRFYSYGDAMLIV